jgi:hypothetical protein
MNDKQTRFIKALRTYYESKQKPAKRHAKGRTTRKQSRDHIKVPDRRQEQYTAILNHYDRLFREGKQ